MYSVNPRLQKTTFCIKGYENHRWGYSRGAIGCKRCGVPRSEARMKIGQRCVREKL